MNKTKKFKINVGTLLHIIPIEKKKKLRIQKPYLFAKYKLYNETQCAVNFSFEVKHYKLLT